MNAYFTWLKHIIFYTQLPNDCFETAILDMCLLQVLFYDLIKQNNMPTSKKIDIVYYVDNKQQ